MYYTFFARLHDFFMINSVPYPAYCVCN